MPRTEKLLHGWREPVPTRPAATVLLMRDGERGPEVLMTRRSLSASFAPGAYVFPGGTLDEADASAAARSLMRTRRDQDDGHLPFAAAAVREAFEELGVLLAWHGNGPAVYAGDLAGILHRSAALDSAQFYQQVQRAGLELALDQTWWLSHWVTDRDLPKRFDVRFLVARMPAGQTPSADGHEQFEPVWVAPAEGLERHARGEFPIVFPTVRTLRQLLAFGSVDAVIDACTSRQQVYFSCPRAGLLADRVERYSEEESPYGELALTTPDGQIAHRLDWQSERPVPLLRHVHRLTAPNPGVMTGPGTNTYVIGENGHYLVIDPGPALAPHIERLAAWVGDGLKTIVCTHSHPDHSPGAALLREALGREIPILGLPSGPQAHESAFFRPDRALADGERLTVADSTLRVVLTPGHAANHLCLVLEQDRLLLSGDHVLNGSTTVVNPPDGNMRDYLESLHRLAREPVDFILPAHGYVLAPAHQAIHKLIAHRLQREAKVLQALRGLGRASIPELVTRAYDDVKPALHPVAARSLLAHLEKLSSDGLVHAEGADWVARP